MFYPYDAVGKNLDNSMIPHLVYYLAKELNIQFLADRGFNNDIYLL